jgi:uncharacterized LabA/DUF88 family protein
MPETISSLNRIAVFIDNSNVFNRIRELTSQSSAWDCFYDPLYLAQKLVGNRHLVYVGFYCSPPPSFLTHGNQEERNRYIKQMQYLSEVAKLQGVTMKYGTVNGVRGSLQEKNLDTQLVADMVTMAAKNQFDVAVLVSNDGDYVSAIRPTKESFGKKVEVLYFRHHASMALRQECDLTRKARLAFFRRLPSLPSMSGQPRLLP